MTRVKSGQSFFLTAIDFLAVTDSMFLLHTASRSDNPDAEAPFQFGLELKLEYPDIVRTVNRTEAQQLARLLRTRSQGPPTRKD